MDFLRIIMDEKIKVHVPLHFINEETSAGTLPLRRTALALLVPAFPLLTASNSKTLDI
jgi:hypothetical protein